MKFINKVKRESYPTPDRVFKVDRENGRAKWTPSGEDYLYWSSESDDYAPKYAKAYKAEMSPEAFLNLTTLEGAINLKVGDDLGFDELKDLDVDKFEQEHQPIYLEIRFINENTAKVTSHEGRHRMFGLMQHGVTNVDVMMFVDSRSEGYKKYEPYTPSHLTLIGQYSDNVKEVVNNPIPMSWESHQRVNPNVRNIRYQNEQSELDAIANSITEETQLNEGTKYDKLASKIISNSGLFSEEVSDKIIDGLFRQDIHAFVHSPSWLEKYLKGIARMLVEEADGDKEKAKEFLEECPEIFDRYLTWVKANREKIGAEKLDDAFVNKMHYQDVKEFLDKIQSELDAQSKDELSKMQFKTSDYTLVPIDSYEQMHKLYGGRATGDGSSDKYAGGGGTAWCHTNNENVYDNWTQGGRKFFVLQKNNWKDIPFNKASNAKNPKDAYGNSLIAISVDRKGRLKNATLRCNHVGVSSNADNQYETYAELSKLAGFNVEEEVLKNLPEEQFSDFVIKDGVLVKYEGDEDYVEIPSNVTRIGEWAFRSNDNIELVKIPDSVASIGDGAFYNCDYLRRISIPDSVTSIGKSAFEGCRRLTSIELSNSITRIQRGAFSICYNLTSISIPNSVTSIGDYAFYNCVSLTSIQIPNSVTSIEDSAFCGCSSLTSVELPDSVTSIGNRAFQNCSNVTNIEIPNSVTSIRAETFSRCSNLTSVVIPNSITSIGWDAFYNCSSLTSVTIPNSVTSIGDGAFYNCTGLTSIKILNSVAHVGDGAFAYCENLIIETINPYVIQYCKDNNVSYRINNNTSESLTESVEKHDTLNTKLWTTDNKLKEEVKEKIEQIVDEFVSSLQEDGIKIDVKDIILVGSNCSYNYTNDSDLDIHIKANSTTSEFSDELYPLIYSAYRSLFNKTFDINFFDIPVEIFVETEESTAKSNGIYSVKNNKWIKEPVKEDIPDIDEEEFEKELTKWEDRYFDIIASIEGKSEEKIEEEVELNEIYPNKGEKKNDFISRFMSVTKDEYPNVKQRYAVALSYWDRRDKK